MGRAGRHRVGARHVGRRERRRAGGRGARAPVGRGVRGRDGRDPPPDEAWIPRWHGAQARQEVAGAGFSGTGGNPSSRPGRCGAALAREIASRQPAGRGHDGDHTVILLGAGEPIGLTHPPRLATSSPPGPARGALGEGAAPGAVRTRTCWRWPTGRRDERYCRFRSEWLAMAASRATGGSRSPGRRGWKRHRWVSALARRCHPGGAERGFEVVGYGREPRSMQRRWARSSPGSRSLSRLSLHRAQSARRAHSPAAREPAGAPRRPKARGGESAGGCGARARTRARAALFALTCFNDVTARDIQRREIQHTRAKGFDTFACAGPWMVPGLSADDLAVRLSRRSASCEGGQLRHGLQRGAARGVHFVA